MHFLRKNIVRGILKQHNEALKLLSYLLSLTHMLGDEKKMMNLNKRVMPSQE